MRLFDPALAIALAALVVVETWVAGDDHSFSFNLARSCLAAATVLTLSVRRLAPGLMALGFAMAMTVESLTTESPDQMAVLFGAIVASYSATAYAGVRDGLPGLGLIALAVSIAITADPSDDISNIAPTLVLFVLLPGAFGLAWARRGQLVSDLSERAEAAEAALLADRSNTTREPAPAMPLTERQHDVVLLVARGFSNREIAAALHLSENTIKGYVSEILAQFGLRDRTQLVIRAYESGLVTAAG